MGFVIHDLENWSTVSNLRVSEAFETLPPLPLLKQGERSLESFVVFELALRLSDIQTKQHQRSIKYLAASLIGSVLLSSQA